MNDEKEDDKGKGEESVGGRKSQGGEINGVTCASKDATIKPLPSPRTGVS